MNRKIVSTLALVGIFFVIVISGSVYAYYFQAKEIEGKEKELKDLKVNAENTEELEMQLADLKNRASELDSILALRKFIIPVDIKQSNFFRFVDIATRNFSDLSHVDLEYTGLGDVKDFKSYKYTVKGTAEFNDLFRLVYAIEQSKELKKITKGSFKNFVEVDEEGFPHYLVGYNLEVIVYYADNDQFASSEYKENKLKANSLYNIFYPLIRDEIPPNNRNLLDVQSGQLLALIPDGAYITDASGKTHLLWEGDEVYLGYLTKIDYDKNEVKFILNKGGIIEKITLKLENKLAENDNKLTSK
jgi:hypothetical protein